MDKYSAFVTGAAVGVMLLLIVAGWAFSRRAKYCYIHGAPLEYRPRTRYFDAYTGKPEKQKYHAFCPACEEEFKAKGRLPPKHD